MNNEEPLSWTEALLLNPLSNEESGRILRAVVPTIFHWVEVAAAALPPEISRPHRAASILNYWAF